MQKLQTIQNRIYQLRGERVMLDFDLAFLYEIEARILNQSVKRNIKRFPADFMFQLTASEWQHISSQPYFPTPTEPSSQIVMIKTPKNRAGKYLPYALQNKALLC